MLVEQWQERLERHFEALARIRADSRLHIFALEHGLKSEEIKEISSLLRSRYENRVPLSTHWLLWVVYSSEHGYTYTGDEYWTSFEKQIPKWESEDRYNLRHCFRKFQKTFNGVVPSGRWADHFTIISWPITHAILPLFLQRQFARILYALRHLLASMETLEPTAIGRSLAANADYTSTRLRKFFQQEELVGRIVLALLGTAPVEGEGPIYREALDRIVEDLNRVRNTREWLGETQHFVRDRFTGIGSGSPKPTSPTRQRSTASQSATQFSVRPSVLLGYRGGATWSVRLEIPSFRNLATLSTDIQSFLKQTRCRLNGADDFKPAGWLLSGNRKGALKSWPDLQKPLIQFEHSNGKIDHILESECRLSPGPTWLFRISNDGTAREIIGRIVRPDFNYIVITTGELPEPRFGMNHCHIDCSGIKSFRLKVPSNVSAEDTAWLKQLDLEVARTIRVWPTGLPGRNWDGEGSSEWLTTEAPCFGIMHDHPVEAYSICLNNGTEKVVDAGVAGHPIFVRIAPLPVGIHTLTIKARRSSSLNPIITTPPAEGFVHLHVREPEPWIPGVASHSGLIVTLDPHDADLDTFWRNEVALSVLGPESHNIDFTVSLKDRSGKNILSKKVTGSTKLPIYPDTWSKTFSRFLMHEENAWKYLEAASGQLEIKAEELGQFSLGFEHDVIPLHWVLYRERNNIVVRLIDETGQEGSSPKALFFSMERPLKAERCLYETASSGILVKPGGGLFYAEQGKHRDMVIVSAGLTNEGLKGLGINPKFAELRDGSVTLAKSLNLFRYWHDSRLYGPLVNARHKQVIGCFRNIIYKKLCGTKWVKAEVAFCDDPKSEQALDTLQRAMQKRFTGFPVALHSNYISMDITPVQASQWYSEVAARYEVSINKKLCDFALKLAYQPHRLPEEFGSELEGMLNAILVNPELLRGARFLTLMHNYQRPDKSVRPLTNP